MVAKVKGSVSVYSQRGKQRWLVRVLFEGERKSLGLFDTEREARECLAAYNEQSSADNDALTLRAWGQTWLAARAADGLHRSEDRDRKRWNRHVGGSWLGQKPLRRIKRTDIVKWVRELVTEKALTASEDGYVSTGKPLSRQTVVHCLNLLRRALHDAADEGRISENHAADVQVPRYERQTEESWTYLSPIEIMAVLDKTKDERQRAIFEVAIFAGLRAGEIWGLRWCDVDFERSELVVSRSYRGPTKSGRIRRIPMLPNVAATLTTWRKTSTSIGQSLVFPSHGGGCHVSGFDAGWPALKRRAGIKRRVRFHDLRHTCASHLVAGTWGTAWPLDLVRDMLGHSSIRVTERYAHLAPERMAKYASETNPSGKHLVNTVELNTRAASKRTSKNKDLS